MKRSGARATARHASRHARATGPQAPASSKAREIVRLIDALVDGLGVRGRTLLGRRIATLMVDAYGKRGWQLPRWVSDLVAFYAPRRGAIGGRRRST